MNKKHNTPDNGLRLARIVVNLNKEEFEFIDKISKDALFTTGRHITKNKIIITFIEVMKELNIDGRNLSNTEELKKRILTKILFSETERRNFSRFKKEVKVLYRKLDSMDEHQQKETINISQGGFSIELNEEHQEGEILEVSITDPNISGNPIKVLGKIIWVKKNKETNVIEAGIRLTYLPQSDKERFNNLFCEELQRRGIK